ncbi:MAG: phosphatase PAP2 family protein [Promethearchaeota archaeon]
MEKSDSERGRETPLWFWIVLCALVASALAGYFIFEPFDEAILLAYQSRSPGLDTFFGIITLFGDELISVILLVLIFYCGDKGVGKRLMFLVVVANFVDVALKGFFGIPRPWVADGNVRLIPDALGQEPDDYSFPSGHSVNVGAFWTYLAFQVPNPVVWAVAGLMLVLVPISRSYLGVHWPSDTFVGVCLGMALAMLFWYLLPRIEESVAKLPERLKLGLGVLLPTLAFVVVTLVVVGVGNDPLAADSSSAAGLLAGISVGVVLEAKLVDLEVTGVRGDKKIVLYRAVLGILLVMATYFGMKMAFGGVESFPAASVLRFVRYFVLSLFGTLVVPWIFSKVEKREK